jgi:hypothetical protein
MVDLVGAVRTRQALGGLNRSGSAVKYDARRWNWVARLRDGSNVPGAPVKAGPECCAFSRMNPSSMKPKSL